MDRTSEAKKRRRFVRKRAATEAGWGDVLPCGYCRQVVRTDRLPRGFRKGQRQTFACRMIEEDRRCPVHGIAA